MAQLVPGDTGAGAGDLPWTVDTFNELLDPDNLVQTGTETPGLSDWRDLSGLCLLNLVYDLTPASLVDR